MIERSLDAGILTLRLAHKKASALDIELLEALLDELNGIGDDTRAVVLTGTGWIFCAGVDLTRIADGGAAYAQRFVPLLSKFLRALFVFPKPIVAATNGHAIAGGCVIVESCDVRLMAAGTGKIGITELLVGVPFPAAAIETIRFAVPSSKLQQLIYTGLTLAPADALAWGLVDEVVPPEELVPRAQAIARQLAAVPAEVYAMTKKQLRADALARMDSSQENDAAAVAEWASPQTHAAIKEYFARTVSKGK
jgi:enoyl-CoA hydratase